jgi:hypothetical protein
MSDPDQILTSSDAARILGLSRDMLRILRMNQRLPSLRAANGYYLFKRGDVEALATERARERASLLRKRGGRR